MCDGSAVSTKKQKNEEMALRKSSESSRNRRTAHILEVELERLKSISNHGQQLTVVWIPDGNSSLAGEVRDDIIFIYDAEIEVALSTLRHEFFDHLICSAILPYQEATIYYKTMFNALLAKLAETAYTQKEKAINALTKIMEESISDKGKPNSEK